MQNKRNISIQIIRIVAMFMIIADHILSRLTFPFQSMFVQVANSGVFIFLLISGYLFGNREIENWKQWFKKRLLRICVPLWIFVAIDLVIEAILWKTFNIKYIFIYLFNLQGIFGGSMGGAPLWFLTLIMICYLITPLLQKVKRSEVIFNKGIWILFISVGIQIICAYNVDFGMVGGHSISWCIIAIGMYICGYFAGNTIFLDTMKPKRIIFSTIVTIITSILVLIFKNIFNGNIIYEQIIIYYGMVAIDLWICTVLYKLGQNIKCIKLIKCLDWLDSISYEFYMVHWLIILVITDGVLHKYGVILYIFTTLILSLMISYLFHRLCEYVIRKIR